MMENKIGPDQRTSIVKPRSKDGASSSVQNEKFEGREWCLAENNNKVLLNLNVKALLKCNF